MVFSLTLGKRLEVRRKAKAAGRREIGGHLEGERQSGVSDWGRVAGARQWRSQHHHPQFHCNIQQRPLTCRGSGKLLPLFESSFTTWFTLVCCFHTMLTLFPVHASISRVYLLWLRIKKTQQLPVCLCVKQDLIFRVPKCVSALLDTTKYRATQKRNKMKRFDICFEIQV